MTRTTIKNPKSEIRNPKFAAERRGSAIILAIVLTTLLAILGVMFLLSSRVDSVATSAVGGNQDLKLAVDTVVAQISEVLTRDVPGVEANNTYYDYPDNFNPWLACLEPYLSGSDYLWQQVSNIYGPPAVQNVQAQILPDYNNMVVPGTQADADGDGVSDSIWVEVPGKMSAKGKPIYAAIRIIDNGGMLNVNTGLKFDPCTSVGTKQSEVNLMAFAGRDGTHTYLEMQNRLRSYRCGTADANFYEQNVVWRYGLPNGLYTPFDISDELVLRYRYILNNDKWAARIENLWTNAFKGGLEDPLTSPSEISNIPTFWGHRVGYDLSDPNRYDYQHLATTYNCDRIIVPDGNKMVNINKLASVPDVNIVCSTLRTVLDPCLFDANQIAVNLIDYLDADSNVTYFFDPCTSNNYFGFETPCVYISEIACNFYQPGPNSVGYDANDPSRVYRSYAIELFKPYWQDDEPNGWQIVTTARDSNGTLLPPTTTTILWTGSRRFHVLANMNVMATIPIDINEPNEANIVGPNVPQTADINFGPDTAILLRRDVNGYGPMIVDSFEVPAAETGGSSWMEPNGIQTASKSFERDITLHRCIRKVWNSAMTTSPTIGYMNRYDSGSEMIQAHPQNGKFTNIGEIGQLFRTDAYLRGPNDTDFSVRLNIADPNVYNFFNHFTIIDPYDHNPIDPNETRIKGRVNINTAPWFVLAQLPWVSYHTPNYELARSIVNHRDFIHGPFRNIGELMTDANNSIDSIGYYLDKTIIPSPLLTPPDGVGDVFEGRDVIFDRISNLVTVRSDVFTAYILVRIGPNGPQKRVIAIFDRSDVTPTSGKVKIVAIQPVPDPR